MTALFIGSLDVTALGCAIGVAMLTRMLMKSMTSEGYGRVELRDGVMVDADEV